MRVIVALLACLMLVACVEGVPKGGKARVLAMGDSLMAWNSGRGQSVAHALEARLAAPVVDRSVPGASFLYGLPITGSLGLRIERQFVEGDWDWVVLNGGGNDFLLRCNCSRCDRVLDRLISADGTQGEVPALVTRVRATGAQVAYLGYLRTPGVTSSIERCGAIGDRFEARLARMAARDAGVVFVSNAGLVPDGDRSFHAQDLIHPSAKGSAAIAARVAQVIAP
ncbi:MAG: SGNH/GDSL hydrolase family protein [Pseudomonadota bacterium]